MKVYEMMNYKLLPIRRNKWESRSNEQKHTVVERFIDGLA